MQVKFWIMAGNVPAGPYSIDEIHRKLAGSEITWQTAACAVGDSVWRALSKTPNFGPNANAGGAPVDIASGARELAALPQLFRTLIAIEVGVSLLVIALSMLAGAADTGPATESPMPVGILIGYVVALIPATIAAWIGMWRIRNWGRWLYLGSTCGSHLLGLANSLFDVSAQWRFPNAVSDISMTIGGVLIGIAFLSPMARTFRASSSIRSA